MLPDLIKTERLLLRPWRFGDVGEVYAHAQDDAWSRFLPVPRPYGERDAETFIAAQLLLDREQHPSWAIESAGQLVGGIHLQVLALGRIREMGYSVARSHWGTGIATEASLGVISEAFRAEPQLARIQASVCPENLASVRVLEKLGMSREGILRRATLVRDTLLDQAWYGLLREDWERPR